MRAASSVEARIMTVSTLKIGKTEYVLLPRKDFDRMREDAKRQNEQDRQDAGDVAEARRRKSRGASKPYLQLRKRLGLT
jgi:hypothetical protein